MYEESSTIVKQMLDLQKVSVEGIISNMIMFWDQTGALWSPLLNQAAWVPEEGKKAFREWIDSNRKGCETFRDAVNKGYASLERFFEKSVQGTS
jgi:hypothetical protein